MLELSRKEAARVSDSDEDMKRAIALSLQEARVDSPHTTGAAEDVAVDSSDSLSDYVTATDTSTAVNGSASVVAGSAAPIVISDDEFDVMCSNNMSLKERLSKSSLDSDAKDEEASNDDGANLPGPSNIPVSKKVRTVL